MCSTQNQQIIDAVVADFISNKQAFTAFDVSKEARNRGADERHRDMRGYIHNVSALTHEVDYGDYRKTQLSFSSGESPFLYHHNSYDPSGYQPTNGMVQTIAPPPSSYSPPAVAASVSTPSTPSVPRNGSDGTFRLSPTLKRLMIPTRLVEACGLKAGEVGYVYQEGAKLVLSKINPGNGKARCIEHNGDLRVSETTLSEAGLTSGSYHMNNVTLPIGTVVEITAA